MFKKIALTSLSIFAISASLVFADTTSSTTSSTALSTVSSTVPVVVAPSILLLAPNGGESIQHGGNYLIRWATRGLPADAVVSIYLRQGNNIIQNIVTSFPARVGSYLWTDIRGELTNSYQIEIWASGGVGDKSDGYFGIRFLTPEELATQVADQANPQSSSNLLSKFIYAWNKDLKYGMKNNADVRALQEALKIFGTYNGPITGNFFSKTRQAVIDFQKKNNFKVVPDSGFVGPYTRKVLTDLFLLNPPARELPVSTPIVTSTPTLISAPVPVSTPAPVPINASLDISNLAFSSTSITIKAGAVVTWTNKDSVPHTVTSDTGLFNSNNLSAGNSAYSHKFDQVGTFAYHCTYHSSMHGTIIVTE